MIVLIVIALSNINCKTHITTNYLNVTLHMWGPTMRWVLCQKSFNFTFSQIWNFRHKLKKLQHKTNFKHKTSKLLKSDKLRCMFHQLFDFVAKSFYTSTCLYITLKSEWKKINCIKCKRYVVRILHDIQLFIYCFEKCQNSYKISIFKLFYWIIDHFTLRWIKLFLENF